MKKVNSKGSTSTAVHRPISEGVHMPDEACEPVQLPIHRHEVHTSETQKQEKCDSLRDRKLQPEHIVLQEPETVLLPLQNQKVHTSKTHKQENYDGLRDRKLQPEHIVFQEDEAIMVLDENKRPFPLVQHVDGPHLQDSQEDSGFDDNNNDDNQVLPPDQSTEPEATITAYKVNNEDIENQVKQAVQERLEEAPVAQVVKTSRRKIIVWTMILLAVLAAAITTSIVLVDKGTDTSDDPVYCSLCYSYREPQANASKSFFSQGVTCEAMGTTLEESYTKDDPSCLLHQTLAFTKCSCPELPPPGSNSNITCSLCPDGSLPTNPDNIAFSDYTKQAKNDDPMGFNSTDPNIVAMTCSALNTYLSHVSHPDLESAFGECNDYQLRDAIHCGCKDVLDGCLTSIAAYNFAEYALTDDRENRYYNFCPNATYITDTVLENGTIVHPWYDRFYIFHSNAHLKCGTDGSSSNRCTISGGGGHLYMFYYISKIMGLDPEREFKNVSVEGFTFTQNTSNDGLAHSVVLHAFGDITIRDCVFVDNDIRYDEAIMAMVPNYFETLTDSSGLLVKVDECTFRDNIIGREEEGDKKIRPSGLIGNTDAEVQVTNSLFQNNTNAAIPPTTNRHAYLVRNTAGVLNLVGNCFIDNSVTIAPVVNELFGEVRQSRFNYVHIADEGPAENNSGCDFIAHFDTGHATGATSIESLSYICEDHDLDHCSLGACPILDCVRWSQVFDEIESYFGTGTLNDTKSPQFKAALWVAGEDDALILDTMSDEIRMRLIQRYALAVLFYSTGGEKDWKSQNNFLSSDHECDWHMDITPEPGTEVFFAVSANGRIPDDFGEEFQNGVVGCTIVGQSGRLITEVQIINNNMTGQIPSDMFIGLPELKVLNLVKNDLHGTIPEDMYDKSKLAAVWLAYNSLVGSIPPLVKNLGKTLSNFWVAYNELTGTIPTEIGNLTLLLNLGLGQNMLKGKIPREMSELTNLELFDAQNCSLTGWVPTSFTSMPRLQVLDLGHNAIGGSIPDDFGFFLPSLTHFELHYTGISGSIPSSIGSLSRLGVLRLDYNHLTGPISPVANLSSTYAITLQHNNFNGTIPQALGGFSDLQYLRMFGNQLSGHIPSSLGSLNKLVELQLNYNRLSGPIPESLGNLNHLKSLFLDRNSLNGTLPSTLGNLRELSYLSVYNNNLEGPIPTSLSALSSLVYLFLEENLFTGSVDFLCDSTFSAEGALWSADCFGEISCSCCGYCCNAANNCSYL